MNTAFVVPVKLRISVGNDGKNLEGSGPMFEELLGEYGIVRVLLGVLVEILEDADLLIVVLGMDHHKQGTYERIGDSKRGEKGVSLS